MLWHRHESTSRDQREKEKMSSPSANLKKVKRSPLPGNRGVPFRSPSLQSSQDQLCTESPLPPTSGLRQPDFMDDGTHKIIMEGIKRQGKVGGAHSKHSDKDLVGSMATRLSQVERELLSSKREIVEKDQYIKNLESRITTLERLSLDSCENTSSQTHQQHLELQCSALQAQVEEMEEFLNDYGMVWIGQEATPTGEAPLTKEQSNQMWSPGESVAKENTVNFDLIIKHVKELNSLCDGAKIKSTPKGATIKPLDPVPLTLFQNGLVFFRGPFRPYTDPVTQHCIQDLTDGYFPSELQSKYPDGVPLQLTDYRDTVFRPREYADIFPGYGNQLGGDKGPSRLLGSGRDDSKVMITLPERKLSLEAFLTRLPASVVKEGRVVDIRSGIAETLQGDPNGSTVKLVETPVLQEIKSRLDVTEGVRPPTPAHTTTLRIREETGDKMYVLKMKQTDTIRTVRQLIGEMRGTGDDYHLKSSFPSKTYSDLSRTLADCGLVPSANLFIAKCQ